MTTIFDPLSAVLIHFLWQGCVIGLGLAIALRLTRQESPRLRYGMSAIAMLLLLATPIATAVHLVSAAEPIAANQDAATRAAVRVERPLVASDANKSNNSNKAVAATNASDDAMSAVSSGATPPASLVRGGIVCAWFLGLIGVSFVNLGGWLQVRRLRLSGTPITQPGWPRRIAALCERAGLQRRVAVLVSARVDVPTVVGWLAPVVLVPTAAFIGMPPQALEALLLHELAHVRRHDYLVNLLQVAVETVLFYHPVVWWVSRRVREEREHCCDDLAVALCGSRRAYLHALADMETIRMTPRLAVAADGGSLVQRVRRLTLTPESSKAAPARWSIGMATMLIAAGVVMTQFSWISPANALSASPAPPAPPVPVAAAAPAVPAPPVATSVPRPSPASSPRAATSVPRPSPAPAPPAATSVPRPSPAPAPPAATSVPRPSPAPAPPAATSVPRPSPAPRASAAAPTPVSAPAPPSPPAAPRGSVFAPAYMRDSRAVDGVIEGTWRARVKRGDAWIEMRREDRYRHNNAFSLDLNEFTGTGSDGIPGFQLRRDAGTIHFEGRLDGSDEWNRFEFRANPDYLSEMRAIGFELEDSLREHYTYATVNLSFDFARGIRDAGYGDIRGDRLVEFAIHGVSPGFIQAMNETGYRDLPPSRLVEFRIHGVSPAFVEAMVESGFKDLPANRLVEFRIHGVTPEFVRGMAESGFANLSANRLVEFRIHGVTPGFVKGMADSGFRGLSASRLVEFRIHGVTPDFVAAMADAGFSDMPASRLVEFRIHGVSGEFVKSMQELGLRDLSPSRLVEMRIHGVTPSFARTAIERHGADLSARDLVEMRIHGRRYDD